METILPGLYLYPDAITPEIEQKIVTWLDTEGKWSNALSRRTQHYGYEYGYTARDAKPTTPITGPLLEVANWLAGCEIMNPTQCIVNEYTVDQGISAHTDAKIFGPVIASLSLLQPTNMIFTHQSQSDKSITLMPRSVLVMTGQARSEWRHEIPKRKTVTMKDRSILKKGEDYRRISLTYRTMT